MKARITAFLTKYSAVTHLIVLAWNIFLGTWATKTSFVMDGTTISATATIDWLQKVMHCPTWAVGLITLGLNAVLMYRNLKTADAKCSDAKKLVGDR